LISCWNHKQLFKFEQPCSKDLFTPASRPIEVQQLYEAAGQTPVCKMRQMDRLRKDGRRASKIFMCTPVLGEARKRKSIKNPELEEIETSKVRCAFLCSFWNVFMSQSKLKRSIQWVEKNA
jgi:hypothetical protein